MLKFLKFSKPFIAWSVCLIVLLIGEICYHFVEALALLPYMYDQGLIRFFENAGPMKRLGDSSVICYWVALFRAELLSFIYSNKNFKIIPSNFLILKNISY